MKCPRCSKPLTDVKGVGICLSCGGAFLAAAATDTVARALDEQAQETAYLGGVQASRRVDTAQRASCPSCSAEMKRFRVGPVEVDTCLDHGTWYDRGELQLVRAALLARAPTEEVPSSPAAGGAGSAAGASGLDLARAPERPRAPSPQQGGGRIDPAVQAKINALAHEEHVAAERARMAKNALLGRHPYSRHGYGGLSALEIVDDILTMFR